MATNDNTTTGSQYIMDHRRFHSVVKIAARASRRRALNGPLSAAFDDELPRRDVNTRLMVIHLKTELLQRQLRRRTGLTAEDRRWMEDGLAAILAATRATEARVSRSSQSADGRTSSGPGATNRRHLPALKFRL
jgi:hypothetical protein